MQWPYQPFNRFKLTVEPIKEVFNPKGKDKIYPGILYNQSNPTSKQTFVNSMNSLGHRKKLQTRHSFTK